MAKLSVQEQQKIARALSLFKTEDKIPHHYIKFIRDGVYEFRVNFGNNELRIFFIYDGAIVQPSSMVLSGTPPNSAAVRE